MNPEEAPKTPPEAETPPAHPPAPPDKPKSKSRPDEGLSAPFCSVCSFAAADLLCEQQRKHLALQDLTTPSATPMRLPTSSWKTNVSSMS